MPKVFPDYKKEARSRVLQAAVSVFTKKGFHETSMDDIANELGVSRGALYLYFRNKENILQELFLTIQQDLREKLENYIDDPDPLTTAARFFDDFAEEKKVRMPLHFEIVSLASHDPGIKKIVMEDNEKDVEVVELFVRKQMAKGNIRKSVDPHVLAQLIIAVYLRSMEKLIIGVEKETVRESWLQSLSLILGTKK